MKLKDDPTRKTDVNPKLCETTPPRREPITDERLTTDVIRPAAAALSLFVRSRSSVEPTYRNDHESATRIIPGTV